MPSEFGSQVARRIRELREAKGLSVRELARRSGIAPESVSRSERAINEVSLTNLKRICAGLGVTVVGFFDFVQQPRPPSFKVPEARRAAELLDALPEHRRRDVLQALELLLVGTDLPSAATRRRRRR